MKILFRTPFVNPTTSCAPVCGTRDAAKQTESPSPLVKGGEGDSEHLGGEKEVRKRAKSKSKKR